MRGAVLAVVVLAATFAGPAVVAAAPQHAGAQSPGQSVAATSSTGTVSPAALSDRSPTVAADRAHGTTGTTPLTTHSLQAAPATLPAAAAPTPRSAGVPTLPAAGVPQARSLPEQRTGDGRQISVATDVGAPTGGVVASFDDRVTDRDQPPNGSGPVTVAHELHLTPRRPGELRVQVRVERRAALANQSGELSLAPSHRATVINASGFERVGDRYWLNASGDRATLTYRLDVNRTVSSGGFEAVDAGQWALVRTPSPAVTTTTGVDAERSYSVAGPGVVDDGLAYMGPHRTYNRTVQGQRISLVVPAAAEMRSDPTAVMASLATASRNLHVGDRDASVLFVAAPTTVDWAHAAQQVGDADAWVQADQSLYDPRNAWLHEYVHTRQAFRTTRETRWLVEGIATYYAALLSLRQGLVDYDEFRRHLLSGTAPRNSEAVLSDPSTWTTGRPEYRKGALVVADIDRRIRLDSDGWRSFQWVFERLNNHESPVALATFTSLVATIGDRRLQSSTRRYATQPSVPTTWGADAHRRAYGWAPPQVSTDLVAVHAVGQGGSRRLGDDPESVTVLTDERLVATVAASNVGDRHAAAVARFRVNFSVVARSVAEIAPNDRATTTVSYSFSDPGVHYVVVGGEALRVRVVEPARSVQVSDVTVEPSGGEADGAVTVVTRVRNRQDRPARLSLPVTVDGEVVTTRTVAVGPNEVRRVEATVRLNRSGQHEVAIAGESAEVNVSDSGEVVTATGTGVLDAGTVDLSPARAGGRTVGAIAMLLVAVAGVSVFYRRW